MSTRVGGIPEVLPKELISLADPNPLGTVLAVQNAKIEFFRPITSNTKRDKVTRERHVRKSHGEAHANQSDVPVAGRRATNGDCLSRGALRPESDCM